MVANKGVIPSGSRWRGRGRPPKIVTTLYDWLYGATVVALYPANLLLCRLCRRSLNDHRVLHIGGPVHVLLHSVEALKEAGVKADFLAIGESAAQSQWDHHFVPSVIPFVRVLEEFWLVWVVVSKYEIIHAHVMTTATRSGWELPFLKRMGRKLVIHYRGCEARDRERNLSLHPLGSICERCDYSPDYACQSKRTLERRRLSRRFGDLFLVTTPDMLDFVPEAIHVPFFASDRGIPDDLKSERSGQTFRVFHVTTHPGIEGTEEIRASVEGLRGRGYDIELVSLENVSHEVALAECRTCDLSIGKMKMGYYANAQIESMLLGVPTITCVRDEFMTDELRNSGFIFSPMKQLEETIEFYMTHPAELNAKRRLARYSILRLHDNEKISAKLDELYRGLSGKRVS